MLRPRIQSSMIERGSAVAANRKAAEPPANRLLGLLPPKDYTRLRPHLRRIPLEYRHDRMSFRNAVTAGHEMS
jgi:hypothetical protein